jgi:ParB/RepB/Spo0J family partition protein
MMKEVALDQIRANPWQTRMVEPPEDYIEELAADIRANGLLQMPVGRRSGEGVELAFGHNRLAAFRLNQVGYLGPATMPVEVRELSDQQMAALAWSENEKRRDLSPLERAQAVRKRMDSFGWTQDDAAAELGISRPAVGNLLRLLKLPDGVQAGLQDGAISERSALALLSLFDLPERVRKAAEAGYLNELKPATIVEMAMDGASSTWIREQIGKIAVSYGRSLKTAPWTLEYTFVGVGLRHPNCKDCALRFRSEYCADPTCYEAKVKLWGDEHPEEANREGAKAQSFSGQSTAVSAPSSSYSPGQRPVSPGQVPAGVVSRATGGQVVQEEVKIEEAKPLSWGESTITATVTWWPVGPNGRGRSVVVGLRLNEGAPAMRLVADGTGAGGELVITEEVREVLGEMINDVKPVEVDDGNV